MKKVKQNEQNLNESLQIMTRKNLLVFFTLLKFLEVIQNPGKMSLLIL